MFGVSRAIELFLRERARVLENQQCLHSIGYFMWANLDGSHLAGNLLVVFYVMILLMVAVYGFHRYILLYLYRKYKHNTYTPKSHFAELPKITIQLPMFNEDTVAQRIIN